MNINININNKERVKKNKENINKEINLIEEKYKNCVNKENNIKNNLIKDNPELYEEELKKIKKEKKEMRRIINARKKMVYCKECERYVEKRNIDSHNLSDFHKKNYENVKIYCDICADIVIRKNFTEHIESNEHKKNAFDIKIGDIIRTRKFEILI